MLEGSFSRIFSFSMILLWLTSFLKSQHSPVDIMWKQYCLRWCSPSVSKDWTLANRKPTLILQGNAVAHKVKVNLTDLEELSECLSSPPPTVQSRLGPGRLLAIYFAEAEFKFLQTQCLRKAVKSQFDTISKSECKKACELWRRA